MNSVSINTETPESRLARRGWRLRHSLWLLAPIVGFGWFSFIGFAYVALRVRKRRWTIIAAVSAAASAFAMAMMELAGDFGAVVTLLVWISSVVYGMILNRDYLRWRAGQTAENAWYTQSASSSASDGQHPFRVDSDLGPNQLVEDGSSAYFAPNAGAVQPGHLAPPPHVFTPDAVPESGARPIPVQPGTTPSSAYATASGGVRVDVNTASPQQIAALPGMSDDLVGRIIAERNRRGGFSGLDELVAAVGIQPHQLIKFRDRLSFSPRTSRPSSAEISGRSGRILDI